MKKIAFACLLLSLFSISCEKEEDITNNGPVSTENDTANKTVSRAPEYYTNSDQFLDHLSVIRESETPSKRSVNIRRLSRVKEEDFLQTISYLNDIMNNSSYDYEKVAAASALVDIGTEEALVPIKKILVFKTGLLHMEIIRKLKRKSPSMYRKIMAEWAADTLSNADIFDEHSERDIMSGMCFYAAIPGHEEFLIQDSTLFLQDILPRITVKMYYIMQKYPKDKIPVDFVVKRLETNFENGTINPNEVNAFLKLIHSHKILNEDLMFSVDMDTALWGLNNNDFKIRQATLAITPLCWRYFGTTARKELLQIIEDMSKNDNELIAGDYPVRTRAEQVLTEIW